LYLIQMQGRSNTNHIIELATLLFYRLSMDVLTATSAIKSNVYRVKAINI
jgi:hypothetical protein